MVMLFFFSLAGCTEEKYADKRPAEQSRFVGLIREWRDTINAAQKNPGLRMQLLEKGVFSAKTHIQDSLQLQFSLWEARVLNLAPDPTASEYIIASFGMNLDGGKMTEEFRFKSLVFTSRTFQSDPAYAILKTLKAGDIIRISGNFKTVQKTINIDSFNDLTQSKNVLDNPEFKVEITTLEKLE